MRQPHNSGTASSPFFLCYGAHRYSQIFLEWEFERPGNPGTTFSAPLTIQTKVIERVRGSNLLVHKRRSGSRRLQLFFQSSLSFGVFPLCKRLAKDRTIERTVAETRNWPMYCVVTKSLHPNSAFKTSVPTRMDALLKYLEWRPLYSQLPNP